MRKQLLRYTLFLSLAGVLIQSCKKDATDPSVNLPVVEGYLMVGHPITVKLYQQKALTDTAKYGAAITGLSLQISDGSTAISLTETKAGVYTYTGTTFLATGKTYTLQFAYLGKPVSAKTVMPTKPTGFTTQYGAITISTTTTPNTDVLDRLSWNNPDSLYHVLVFNNADGAAFPLSTFGGNRPANFEINASQAAYYDLTQNSFPYYGHYSIILEHVNLEYINVIKGVSGSTSQNLTNLPTNVVNGVGIFTAMQSDTLSFEVF